MPRVIKRARATRRPYGVVDHPSTYEEADKIAGIRLDRRKCYAIINGAVHELARWSQSCSGCHDNHPAQGERGCGCRECGYSGRVRISQWVNIQQRDVV